MLKFQSKWQLIELEELGSGNMRLLVLNVWSAPVPSVLIIILLVFLVRKYYRFVSIPKERMPFFLYYKNTYEVDNHERIFGVLLNVEKTKIEPLIIAIWICIILYEHMILVCTYLIVSAI